ncbi:hypothetical protein [Pseudoclavibacter helvolus]|uniref:hypothetical protein n=1 Tax=Pseudoclavibacter helvolus TaxID=255205 RepID=UPI003C73A174
MKIALAISAGVFLLGVTGVAVGAGYGHLSRLDPSLGPAWFPNFALAAGYWGMLLLVLSIPAVVVLGLLSLFQIARADAKKSTSAIREPEPRPAGRSSS